MASYKKYTSKNPRKYFHINGIPCTKAEYYYRMYLIDKVRRSMVVSDLDTVFIEDVTPDEVVDRGLLSPAEIENMGRRYIPDHSMETKVQPTEADIKRMNGASMKTQKGYSAKQKAIQAIATDSENDYMETIKLDRRENLNTIRRKRRISGAW